MEKLNYSLILASTCLLGSAEAAVISWGPAEGTSSVSQIANTGTTVVAVNGGHAGIATNVTLNGVTFTQGTPLGPSAPAHTGLMNGATTGNADFDNLLNNVSLGGGPDLVTLDLGTFTPGNDYLVQVFFTEQRTNSALNERVMRYGSQAGAATGGFVDLEGDDPNNNGAPWGQFAVGTFTADGSDPDLTLDAQGFGNAHITAYQVRDLGQAIPEPSSALLFGLGGLALIARRRK